MKKFYRRLSIATGFGGKTEVHTRREFRCGECGRKEEVVKTRQNITIPSLMRLDRLFDRNNDNHRIFFSFYNGGCHISMSHYG